VEALHGGLDLRVSEEPSKSFVPVFRAHGNLEGEIYKDFLEAQGIPTLISSSSLSTIYGVTIGEMGQSMLYVEESNEEKAKELIRRMQAGEFSNERLAECPIGCEIFGPHSHSQDDQSLNERKKVLFLCTGNSDRSQMAEALVNYDLWDQWVAYSAGTNPTGIIHPLALQVLEEAGIFHQGYSKNVDIFKEESFDLVITVCDHANETCPLWLGSHNRLHIRFPDPEAAEGSSVEKLQAFRRCLSQIRESILPLLTDHV
jgi:arsenate reductase